MEEIQQPQQPQQPQQAQYQQYQQYQQPQYVKPLPPLVRLRWIDLLKIFVACVLGVIVGAQLLDYYRDLKYELSRHTSQVIVKNNNDFIRVI